MSERMSSLRWSSCSGLAKYGVPTKPVLVSAPAVEPMSADFTRPKSMTFTSISPSPS